MFEQEQYDILLTVGNLVWVWRKQLLVVAVASQAMVVRSHNQTRCRLRDDGCVTCWRRAGDEHVFLAFLNLLLVDIEIWEVLLLYPIVKSSIVAQIQIDRMTDSRHWTRRCKKYSSCVSSKIPIMNNHVVVVRMKPWHFHATVYLWPEKVSHLASITCQRHKSSNGFARCTIEFWYDDDYDFHTWDHAFFSSVWPSCFNGF